VRTGDLARLGRTVVQLQPGQIGHRVRLRGQRAALHWLPPSRRWLLSGPDPGTGPGWPTGFGPLDARIARGWPEATTLRMGEINLLGHTRTLAPRKRNGADWAAADWNQLDAPLLWRFHLYYWDWAWALATDRKRAEGRRVFSALWRSWHTAVTPGVGEAWRPYPAALRAWSFCGVHRALVEGSEIDAPFRAELAAHTGYLRRHLEADVGGNHLLKDLKALAGLSVFFGDEQLLEWTLNRLTGQLAVQVLPDGGHYERAPAYHCQVLADLVDVAALLRATDRALPAELPAAINAMRRWLGTVLSPAGEVPLLNDGFPVSQDLVAGLRPSAPPEAPLAELPDSGLVRATAGGWQLLADIGAPCPDELPAHAHADTLSCLAWVDKEPLLVDTGTSTYAAGATRAFERSTAAHNTAEIDHADSTEVWGTFRAARRARVYGTQAGVEDGTVTIEAAHDGYRRLRGHPQHRRRWVLTEQLLQIDDDVTGRGPHTVSLRWHLAPGAVLRLMPGGAKVRTPAGEFEVIVTATSQPALVAETADISTGFGSTTTAAVLACTVHAPLPVQICTTWHRTGQPQETS
jgi:uncharacterized heparinase superfamily protein